MRRVAAIGVAVVAATLGGACHPAPEPPAPEPVEESGRYRACLGEDCTFETVESALRAAVDGDRLRILPGSYRDGGVLRAHGVTIVADGAHLFGRAYEEKASLVVKGNGTVIEGLRCSHIRVPDANGACVRAEGRDLTLRRVHFHDAQTGILTGRDAGRVVIEDSRIEDMGNRPEEGGNAHGVYIGAIEEFVLRRSSVLRSSGEGHEVKSRAAVTTLEGNVIASLDGRDSRLVDLPNGGRIVIRGNVLEEGPRSVNVELIGIGLERGRGHGIDHDVNDVVIEDNVVLVDGGGRRVLVRARDADSMRQQGNAVIGGRLRVSEHDHRIDDRESAGLDDYPFLPEAGWRPGSP